MLSKNDYDIANMWMDSQLNLEIYLFDHKVIPTTKSTLIENDMIPLYGDQKNISYPEGVIQTISNTEIKKKI